MAATPRAKRVATTEMIVNFMVDIFCPKDAKVSRDHGERKVSSPARVLKVDWVT